MNMIMNHTKAEAMFPLSNKQTLGNFPVCDFGLTAVRPKYVAMTEKEWRKHKEEREKEEEWRLSQMLDSETTMRFAYVPFVIAKLVWDYADTLLSEVARMKLSETKPLCRAIRQLKREYDQIRAPYIDSKHEDSEEENMYVYEDGVARIMNQCLSNVRIDLKSEYPELDEEEYLPFLVAVYQCDITLKSLLLYTERMTAKVAQIIDRHVGHILPESLYKLNRLVLEFVGDKPVSEKFKILKKKYIETFATQMALVELSEVKEEDENSTKSE